MSTSSRTAYTGPFRKLVLAFDVGTTFSGISYSILDPGQVPEIRGVTRFPAQEHVGGDSKIPTILYYDLDGNIRAAGAEAMKEGIEDMAEEEEWAKAEWFKLHMRPKTQSGSYISEKIPPLPRGKTVMQVFADFIKYLYDCARTYIQDTHANGQDLWKSVEDRIHFVLTHPNGWEGAQQAQMRNAAILAGLVPDNEDGRSRITFVTEGEASLHFCIQSGLTTEAMKNGDGVLIVDAGGGTIDISSYGQSNSPQLAFEEIASPQCHFQGSIFVTAHARVFLEDLLRDSKFADDVPHITKCFDRTTKLGFRNANEPQYIKFGSARDRDLKLGIRSGQLKLAGSDVASFFEPSITCIVQAILEQRDAAQKKISSVFLVGGFAASDWLFSRLKESLQPLGVNFCRPDSHVNKAVADGAISFHLDHYVATRVARHDYGIICGLPYDPLDPDHLTRAHLRYKLPSGEERVPNAFSVILPKNKQVSETTEFRSSYFREGYAISDFHRVIVDIQSYRGRMKDPKWREIDAEMYATLCSVEVDLTELAKGLQQRRSIRPGRGIRGSYYRVDYDVILLFGLTELKAQLSWYEGGTEKRSPAKIIYDENIVYAN
ncbi:hypothetical protein BDQ17DRAFT_1288292 [Cyathus striatus]|nr:hypothetical protein BDQ17DRAFT_1288292 [Cyathus striatus]